MLVGAALYGLEFEKPRSHPVTMAFRLNQVEGNLEEALGLVRGLRGAEAGEVD
jgi:hypothetical protein